jgi:hypothetical protein
MKKGGECEVMRKEGKMIKMAGIMKTPPSHPYARPAPTCPWPTHLIQHDDDAQLHMGVTFKQ